MMATQDPEELIHPDDTLPPAPPMYPPPLRRMEPGAAWKVDRDAPALARLCAGWAQRGRSLAELVGVVRQNCACDPAVMPRIEIASRVAPGRLLEALRAIRAEPGRLAVVEVSSDPRGREDPEYRQHWIRVPGVDVEDTRGLLEPLSAKRRELLDLRMGECRRPLSWPFIRDLFDHHTPDALYLEATLLQLGCALQICQRRDATPEERRLLEAASYEAHPGKLTCLVYPDKIWEREAAAWIDLERLGLRPGEDPCSLTTRLRIGHLHSEGVRLGVYG